MEAAKAVPHILIEDIGAEGGGRKARNRNSVDADVDPNRLDATVLINFHSPSRKGVLIDKVDIAFIPMNLGRLALGYPVQIGSPSRCSHVLWVEAPYRKEPWIGEALAGRSGLIVANGFKHIWLR